MLITDDAPASGTGGNGNAVNVSGTFFARVGIWVSGLLSVAGKLPSGTLV